MKYKLILLTLFVGILPLSLAGYILNSINQEALRSNIKEIHTEKANNMAGQAERFLDDTVKNIQVSLYNKDFEEMSIESRQNHLDFLLTQYPQIQLFTVLDEDRAPIITAYDGDRITPARYRRHLETIPGFSLAAGEGAQLSDVYREDGGEGMLTALGLPLKNGREMLVAEIEVGRFLQSLCEERSAGSAVAFLVNEKGRALAHPDKSLILADLSDRAIVRTLMVTGAAGSGEFDENGKVLIGSYAPTAQGWGAIIQEPKSAVFAAAARMQKTTYLFMGIGVLLAVVGGIAFAGRFVAAPIARLAEGAKELGKGNLDYEFHVHSSDEVGTLADTFNVMTRDLKEAQQQLITQELVRHELNIATEIQKSLLPSKPPELDGFNLGSFYQAAREVGGDYFDHFMVAENKLGIVIADVSGKGVPGAMVMTMARSVLHSRAVGNASPAALLSEVNALIQKDIKRGMFISMFYVIVDISNGEMTYATAGHNPMVVRRAAGKKLEFLKPKGIALGLRNANFFDKIIQEESARLNPGDLMLLYTDGVNEAMDAENRQYGDDRLNECLLKCGGDAQGTIEAIFQDVQSFTKGHPQSDDITLVAFKAD